jgi:hypothetical protein
MRELTTRRRVRPRGLQSGLFVGSVIIRYPPRIFEDLAACRLTCVSFTCPRIPAAQRTCPTLSPRVPR